MRISIVVVLLIASSGCSSKSRPILAGGRPVNDWVRALSDPNPALRKKAADKLGNVGSNDPAVVAALCGGLQDQDADVRCAVILAFVKIGPVAKEAIGPLKAMGRQDGDPRVRSYAAKAVERLEQ